MKPRINMGGGAKYILKNKAFTLIELLAVIVILAIIALIAVPIILDLVGNTKNSSIIRSGELYLKSVEQSIGRKNLNDKFNPKVCNIQEDGNLICEGIELKVETKGSRPSSGTITLNNGKLTKVKGMKLDNYELETNKQIKLVIKEPLNPTGTYLMKNSSRESDSTFFNGTIKRNQIESIKIEDTKEIPIGVIGSWDVSELQDRSVMAWYTDVDNNGLYELYIGGEGGVKANPNSKFLFSHFTNIKEMDLNNLDTTSVTNMAFMFEHCTNLEKLDISNFDTSNVTTMVIMFQSCQNLKELDVSNFDTSNVIDMSGMFDNCQSLKELDVSNFNTSKVRDMHSMFRNCQNLIKLDVSNFDTSNVTNIYSMFQNCQNLVELDLSHFDTRKVTDMSSMFQTCPNLETIDVSSFDISNVTSIGSMFQGCSNLIEIDLSSFKSSKVTYARDMFNGCQNLVSVNLKNFSSENIDNVGYMFQTCPNLETIDLRSLDLSSTNVGTNSNLWMINITPKLSTIYVKNSATKSFVEKCAVNSGSSNLDIIIPN